MFFLKTGDVPIKLAPSEKKNFGVQPIPNL
jgi:hypothetical protein